MKDHHLEETIESDECVKRALVRRNFRIRTTIPTIVGAVAAAIVFGMMSGARYYNQFIVHRRINVTLEFQTSYSKKKTSAIFTKDATPSSTFEECSAGEETQTQNDEECENDHHNENMNNLKEIMNDSNNEKDDEDDEGNEPNGQHLLVDIENVNFSLLHSEEVLARKMQNIATISGLGILSYFCHSLASRSVDCVGLFPESHITLHTFPTAGIISIDIFTVGQNSLISLVPHVMQLFGTPQDDIVDGGPEPHSTWTHKLRGFAVEEHNAESRDYEYALGTSGTHKEHVVTTHTMFQSVDILDVGQSRFLSQTSSKSIELEAGGSFQLNRLLYLDGVIQSSRFGESAYHESLVHPAMFTHKNPKRVAIIGGGEGATLREVLKHKSVEKVVMVEIDGELMNLAREYLPEWNDCRNIVGGAECCFDDPRAEVYATDAISWLIERFSKDTTKAGSDPEEGFDVIIMDALDPSSFVSFSDMLYNNNVLSSALSRALGESGIFVAQLGQVEGSDGLPSTHNGVVAAFIDQLVQAGFEKITNYEEMHSRFDGVWSYMLAFKDSNDHGLWLQNEAELNLVKREKILDSVDGTPLLRFFDGATMMSYQFPNRIIENLWCLNHEDLCSRGYDFDPDVPNFLDASVEVRVSEIEGAALGVFSTQIIPKGAYIAAEQIVNWMFIPPTVYSILSNVKDALSSRFQDRTRTSHALFGGEFRWDDVFHGGFSTGVDTGAMAFANHGCNGNYNVGARTLSQEDSEFESNPQGLLVAEVADQFNPYHSRHFLISKHPRALRDIRIGEELLVNCELSLFHAKQFGRLEGLRSQGENHVTGTTTK